MKLSDFVPLFAEYYKMHPTWGAIHVIFADENWDHGGDEYFAEWAQRHSDALGITCAKIVQRLNERQRERLRDMAEAYADETVAWQIEGDY